MTEGYINHADVKEQREMEAVSQVSRPCQCLKVKAVWFSIPPEAEAHLMVVPAH